MNNQVRWLLAAVALAAASLCHAGGSVAFEDVERLMRAQPATHQWLVSTLELPETADAAIRFGHHFRHLGGARIGPYTFRAKVKGTIPPVELEVTVCTGADFYDQAGQRVSTALEKTAVRVQEKLTAVLVRDVREDGAATVCPTD
ncbi:MAG: hypothetical protein VB032_06475 [Burkholderiaceae bacterium]|nr:hypothetical protein [Burkholderiaceae bacterium]